MTDEIHPFYDLNQRRMVLEGIVEEVGGLEANGFEAKAVESICAAVKMFNPELSDFVRINLRSVGSNPRRFAVAMLTVWAESKLSQQEDAHA